MAYSVGKRQVRRKRAASFIPPSVLAAYRSEQPGIRSAAAPLAAPARALGTAVRPVVQAGRAAVPPARAAYQQGGARAAWAALQPVRTAARAAQPEVQAARQQLRSTYQAQQPALKAASPRTRAATYDALPTAAQQATKRAKQRRS